MNFEAFLVAVHRLVFSSLHVLKISCLKYFSLELISLSLGPSLQSLDQSGVKFLSIFVVAGGLWILLPAVSGILLIFLPTVADRFQVLDFCFFPDRFGWVWNPLTVARDF